MNLETMITIYKFTPQVFTLTLFYVYFAMCQKKNPCKVLIYRDFFVLQFFPAERRGFEPTTITAYISATSLSKFQIGNETVTIFTHEACPTLTAVCLPNFRVQRYCFLLNFANA